jgi:hypothetical protein
LIISAIEKYDELTKSPTAKMRILRTWILIQQRMLTAKGEQTYDADAIRKRFSPLDREEFRKAYYPLFKQAESPLALW